MSLDPLGPYIHLVDAPTEGPETVWFCTWCGARQPDIVYAGSPTGPDCVHCGNSPVRVADAYVAPLVDAPFLTIDAGSRIITISRRAVELLRVCGAEKVRGKPIGNVLLDAEVEGGDDRLRAVTSAIAGGQRVAHRLIVRPAKTFGVHYRARLAVCHPPRAALLVLD